MGGRSALRRRPPCLLVSTYSACNAWCMIRHPIFVCTFLPDFRILEWHDQWA